MINAIYPDLREQIDVNRPEEWVGVAGVCRKIKFTNRHDYPIQTVELCIDGGERDEAYTADGRYQVYSTAPVLRRVNPDTEDTAPVQPSIYDLAHAHAEWMRGLRPGDTVRLYGECVTIMRGIVTDNGGQQTIRVPYCVNIYGVQSVFDVSHSGKAWLDSAYIYPLDWTRSQAASWLKERHGVDYDPQYEWPKGEEQP